MNEHDRPACNRGDGASEHLRRARSAYEARAWADAHQTFSEARRCSPLSAEDLDRLALAAYLIDRDEEYLETLEAAHRAYLEDGQPQRSARCAFWLGLRRAFRGEMGPAGGWLARAERLLRNAPEPCAERGYLLLPEAEQQLQRGDWAAARSLSERAAHIGERCSDPDLVASARHVQGRALLEGGCIREGLGLLDETMVAVTSGELSPLVTGLVYCSVLEACQRSFLLGRACEWTEALGRWCEAQPQMTVFWGKCQTHRAEVLQLKGAWSDAIAAAHRVCRHYESGRQSREAAAGYYRIAEVHRLRGELGPAQDAYEEAAARGCDPQPGLSLLRMAEGRWQAALSALARALETTTEPMPRARLLTASVEAALAADRLEQANRHVRELEAIASRYEAEALTAQAKEARGAVLLAGGRAATAVPALRRALQIWQTIGAPYQSARVRAQIGLACRALGDREGALRELESARAAFATLGAAPDLARVEALSGSPTCSNTLGLTPRELDVLALAARGLTNKAIACQLSLSEKTIERHMSNVFRKLDVPTRTAAAAYAFKHGLL